MLEFKLVGDYDKFTMKHVVRTQEQCYFTFWYSFSYKQYFYTSASELASGQGLPQQAYCRQNKKKFQKNKQTLE